MKYLTIAEASAQSGKHEQRLRLLCKQGRIPGARKFGKAWMLPDPFVISEKNRTAPTNQP